MPRPPTRPPSRSPVGRAAHDRGADVVLDVARRLPGARGREALRRPPAVGLGAGAVGGDEDPVGREPGRALGQHAVPGRPDDAPVAAVDGGARADVVAGLLAVGNREEDLAVRAELGRRRIGDLVARIAGQDPLDRPRDARAQAGRGRAARSRRRDVARRAAALGGRGAGAAREAPGRRGDGGLGRAHPRSRPVVVDRGRALARRGGRLVEAAAVPAQSSAANAIARIAATNGGCRSVGPDMPSNPPPMPRGNTNHPPKLRRRLREVCGRGRSDTLSMGPSETRGGDG